MLTKSWYVATVSFVRLRHDFRLYTVLSVSEMNLVRGQWFQIKPRRLKYSLFLLVSYIFTTPRNRNSFCIWNWLNYAIMTSLDNTRACARSRASCTVDSADQRSKGYFIEGHGQGDRSSGNRRFCTS